MQLGVKTHVVEVRGTIQEAFILLDKKFNDDKDMAHPTTQIISVTDGSYKKELVGPLFISRLVLYTK